MPKRIDPIRHWSIVVFVACAVGTGVLVLPPMARLGGWSLEPKTRRDIVYTALATGLLFAAEFMIWREVLDLVQDWGDKLKKKATNPYDQRRE